MEKKIRICPICNCCYDGYPALSRKDNKTPICPDCGMKEALDALYNLQSKLAEEIINEDTD